MLMHIQKLTELCDRIVAISTEALPAGLDRDALVESIRASTAKLKALTRECNELFANEIDPVFEDCSALTDEDDDAFFALAQKLSSFDSRIDTGMALKIYQALLNRARALDDRHRILKYLYWCGITLFYNNENRKSEILAYFEEGAAYKSEYMSMTDRTMRSYVHRCLGNRVMMLFSMDDAETALLEFQRTLGFWNMLMFLGIDLDLPWTTYFLSCCNHYRQLYTLKMHSSPGALTRDEIKSIFRVSHMMGKLSQKDAAQGRGSGSTRYDLMLWEAQFVAGQISMKIFRENVKNAQARFAPGDYSASALHANIMLPCYLIFYSVSLMPDDEASDATIKEQLEYVTAYVKALPPDIDPGSLSTYISLFARSTSGLLPSDEHFPLVVRLTTYRHKPTYAHAVTVSKLTGRILGEYVLRHPGHFIGILGIETEEQALEKRDSLISLAEKCGLCHDVGKLPFVRSQTMYARTLTDDEIYLVRDHVKEGLTYFWADTDTDEMNAYRHVIEGHHVHYDGSGGYPDDFDISSSPYRALIHALAVADSLDAATDDIGKVYARSKSTDEVIKEISGGAGTRYSPYIADLLSNSGLRLDIDRILSTDRMDAYFEAYLFANSAHSDGGERNG